jgi:hypothetical protein
MMNGAMGPELGEIPNREFKEFVRTEKAVI